MKRSSATGLATPLIALFLANCQGPVTKTERLLTIDVRLETPNGLSHGLSQIRTTETLTQPAQWCKFLMECKGSYKFQIEGSAPKLWLSDNKIVYMLLSGENQKNWIRSNIAHFYNRFTNNTLEMLVAKGGDGVDLDGDGFSDIPPNLKLPYFLYVDSTENRKAKFVNPYRLEDDLGAGYRLKSVSLSSYQISPPGPPTYDAYSHPCPFSEGLSGKMPPEVSCQSMRSSK